MVTVLDEATVAGFRADGAVVLRGLFAGWVPALREGVERNLREPGPFGRTRMGDQGGGAFFSDYCNWQRIPEYEQFLRHSAAAPIAGALMGARSARLFHEHVLVKEPGAARETPWHHDLPYYCVDGEQHCSVWVALDEVPRERGVEFVAGSHRWGRRFRPTLFNLQPLNEAPGFEPIPDIANERDRHRILGWDLEPGDAVAFTFLTVHGAPPNLSARRRRGFSTRWVGDDAVFADRGGPTSPPFPGLALRPGEPLDGPEFPVLWRAQAA